MATTVQRTGESRRVLVAGVGNLLRGDDGFGIAVAQQLAQRTDLPAGVTVIEVGIGGIELVLALHDGYDALIIVDAVERGAAPGTLYLLQLEAPDLAAWPFDQRADFLADMHMTTPSRALVLARALGVLPSTAYLLGCQPTSCDELVIGLSPPVERAVGLGVERLLAEIARIQVTARAVAAATDEQAGSVIP